MDGTVTVSATTIQEQRNIKLYCVMAAPKQTKEVLFLHYVWSLLPQNAVNSRTEEEKLHKELLNTKMLRECYALYYILA